MSHRDRCAENCASLSRRRRLAHRRLHGYSQLLSECADEPAGVRRALSVRAPAWRTGAIGVNLDPSAATRWRAASVQQRTSAFEQRDQGCECSSMTQRPTWKDVHAGASLPVHDASLIGERAATGGRGATEGGDGCAGAKRALSVRVPASRIVAPASVHTATPAANDATRDAHAPR